MAQKYVIVHFVDKAPDEFAGVNWPLHITLLANFSITEPLERLRSFLSEYVSHAKPIEAIADGEELFGYDRYVAVSLIRPTSSIIDMHKELFTVVSKFGGVFDEPQYQNEGYRPHATIQKTSRLQDGQSISINSISLVDMFPNNDISRRKIVETYNLSG